MRLAHEDTVIWSDVTEGLGGTLSMSGCARHMSKSMSLVSLLPEKKERWRETKKGWVSWQ